MCTHVMEVEVKLPRGTRMTQGRVEGHGSNMPNVNSYLYEDVIVYQAQQT